MKRLEKLLKLQAKRRGFEQGSKRWKLYVYGTMNRIKNRKRG